MTNSKTCCQCGTEFDTTDWYPTVARHDEDGVEIHSFCSTECREDWEAERDHE